MERKKSTQPVKTLKELLLPFSITFPINIEISVNKNFWKYKAGETVLLSFEEYEALAHSSYAQYLGH